MKLTLGDGRSFNHGLDGGGVVAVAVWFPSFLTVRERHDGNRGLYSYCTFCANTTYQTRDTTQQNIITGIVLVLRNRFKQTYYTLLDWKKGVFRNKPQISLIFVFVCLFHRDSGQHINCSRDTCKEKCHL